MKTLYTLLAFCLTIQLQAQSGYQAADKLIRDFTQYWSVPGHAQKLNTRGIDLTHKLDSIVTRDGFDQLVSRTEMTYDDQNRTTEMRQFGPDSANTQIILQSIIRMEYFDLDLPNNVEIIGYDEATQQLVTQIAIEFFYDNQQRVDSLIISTEDPFFGGFGPLLATKQVYNGDLLVQTRQWFNFILLGGWIPAGFTDYQYDSEDRLLDQLTSVVDISTGEILPDSRIGYEYNSDGLLEVQTEYIWEDPNWTPTQRFQYEYYDNGTIRNETLLIYSNGNFENNVLTHYSVEEVTDQQPVTSYIWDPLVSSWRHTDSTMTYLNPTLPWDKVLAPTEFSVLGSAGFGSPFEFVGSSIINTDYFIWDTTGTQLFFTVDDVYYYSLLESSGTSTVLPEYLSILPNPAQDHFIIQMDTPLSGNYAVYSATGAQLEKGSITGGSQYVNTASWPTGMYYVVVRMDDGSSFVHKQVIE